MPTEEQLASRKALTDFVESVAKPLRKFGATIKSEWFGRPDAELKGWIERGRAIEEIKDTLGYRLIMTQADKEIRWAQAQLEVCEEKEVIELRMYLRSLRFLHDFILTTEKNADIAGTVLAGREGAIGREAFVRNARVES
jgi:hypothetical protein